MKIKPDFAGAAVLSLESRRAEEMGLLIGGFNGLPTVAPSIREVPLETNTPLLEFANDLKQARVQHLICMTGVGTQFLLRQLKNIPEAIAALQNTNIVIRSNKATAVLREHGLTATLVNDPHTWHEVQAHYATHDLSQQNVWIAEFGEDTPAELISSLKASGAKVQTLALYRWALPEDTKPLETAIRQVCNHEFTWLLLTSGVQLWHAMTFAKLLGLETDFRTGLQQLRIASIGPTCNEAILELGLTPSLTAEPHKMGSLVRAAALAT